MHRYVFEYLGKTLNLHQNLEKADLSFQIASFACTLTYLRQLTYINEHSGTFQKTTLQNPKKKTKKKTTSYFLGKLEPIPSNSPLPAQTTDEGMNISTEGINISTNIIVDSKISMFFSITKTK